MSNLQNTEAAPRVVDSKPSSRWDSKHLLTLELDDSQITCSLVTLRKHSSLGLNLLCHNSSYNIKCRGSLEPGRYNPGLSKASHEHPTTDQIVALKGWTLGLNPDPVCQGQEGHR